MMRGKQKEKKGKIPMLWHRNSSERSLSAINSAKVRSQNLLSSSARKRTHNTNENNETKHRKTSKRERLI